MLQAESARVRSQLDQAGAEADEARAALKVSRRHNRLYMIGFFKSKWL